LNKYKIVSAVGIAIFMFLYVTIMWLGNFIWNPNTIQLGLWIKNNLPFAYAINNNENLLLPMDYLFFAGILLAFLGSLLSNYRNKPNVRFAFGKTLFFYSIFAAILIFFTVEVASYLFVALFGVTEATNGFPWWTSGVTTATDFFKYPNFNKSPSVYFLNYGELFIILLISMTIGYYLYTKPLKKSRQVL